MSADIFAATLLAQFSVLTVFAGVHTLDLSNTLVDDADISHLMRQCTAIQVLKLAGCRKLTSVSTILCGPTSGMFHRSNLSG